MPDWTATVEYTGADTPTAGALTDALPHDTTTTHDTATGRFTATFTVGADTPREALGAALDAAERAVTIPGRITLGGVAVRAATDPARPAPTLVGLTEIAGLLGVSRQRAGQLATRDDFPAPLARLAAGPVYDEASVAAFVARWDRRRTGRPRTYVDPEKLVTGHVCEGLLPDGTPFRADFERIETADRGVSILRLQDRTAARDLLVDSRWVETYH